jgi:hypothetical protein
MYASPEQMGGGREYDASTDVYSLGVMLFEMCHPMFTGMERAVKLQDLHKGTFPFEWHQGVATEFPELHALLVRMLSKVPQNRPSSATIAEQIDNLLGKMTVLSLDRSKSRGDGAVLLRVEALQDVEGVLPRTVQLIKSACAEGEVVIDQYGLRGGSGATVMEFALTFPRGGLLAAVGDNHILDRILKMLSDEKGIGIVRQCSD